MDALWTILLISNIEVFEDAHFQEPKIIKRELL